MLKFADLIQGLCQRYTKLIDSQELTTLDLEKKYLKVIMKIDTSIPTGGLSDKQLLELEEKLGKQLEKSFEYLIAVFFQYYKKKVYFLIDEYYAPIQKDFFNDYYDKLIVLFKKLFIFLKDSTAELEQAVFTGVQRISKEGIFSNFNNITVFSALHDTIFNEDFGLTDEELEILLKDWGRTKKERIGYIQARYGGYYFGGKQIYNLWSITKAFPKFFQIVCGDY